jgi:uridine kinase
VTVPPARRAVILLTGPSGSGKSHLARRSGLSVLCLDDFYRDGDDPALPRQDELGIVDWDDPRAWDAEAAVAALVEVCERGEAEVPVYDLATDRAARTRRFVADTPVVVAEGIFAAEIVEACRRHGILADAITVVRRPWKNYARRLVRDLREARKPPATLLLRGRLLMAREAALVEHQVARGCRPLRAGAAEAALRAHA